jgi:hypothetical protein
MTLRAPQNVRARKAFVGAQSETTSSLRSGRAAQLAGQPGDYFFPSVRARTRAEFFEACGRYQVSVFNYDPEEAADELRRDVETLRNLPDAE